MGGGILANHEFGLMQQEPTFNESFNSYESQKYNCIMIDDVLIEPIMGNLQGIDCYWHTRKISKKGLAYSGISLIPPKSIEAFISILSSLNKQEYSNLIELAIQAKEKGKYIIHFGI